MGVGGVGGGGDEAEGGGLVLGVLVSGCLRGKVVMRKRGGGKGEGEGRTMVVGDWLDWVDETESGWM